MRSEFYSSETKDGRVLGVGAGKEGERNVDYLCLLTGFTKRKVNSLEPSGSFATWSKSSTKVGLLPSHRALSSLMITFQREGCQLFEKDTLHYKTGERLFKYSYVMGQKGFTVTTFLK